jgi:hypothetical protein
MTIGFFGQTQCFYLYVGVINLQANGDNIGTL